DAIARPVTSGLEDVARRFLAFESRFRFVGPECMAADAGDPDRYIRECARCIELNYGCRAANGEPGRLLCHLEVRASDPSRLYRDLDFTNDLILLQSCGHHIHEELRTG